MPLEAPVTSATVPFSTGSTGNSPSPAHRRRLQPSCLPARSELHRAPLNRILPPRGSNLLPPGVAEELLQRTVVGGDGGRVGVLVGAVQPVAANAEDDGVSAPLVVETPVRGTVLAQEIGAVALVARGLLEAAYLRAVPVGVVRWVSLIDHRGDAGLAEGRQIGGDLGSGLAVQVGVLGREADVNPRLRLGRDLVVGLVGGLDPGDVDGGAPGFLGGDGVGGQQVRQAALQL